MVKCYNSYILFFRQKTAYEMRISDWSSDVCSSDLQPCESCNGARLKPDALAVKIAGEDISIPTRRSVVDALAFFESLPRHLTDQQNQIAKAILKEIVE